jgi:hypothetical protein
MLENIQDSPAESTRTSLANLGGNSLRRSGRDVARRSLTLPALPSCESSETALILMAMLAGITKFTTNGDVMVLGMCAAEDICQRYGISREEFRRLADQFLLRSRALRDWNPFAFQD